MNPQDLNRLSESSSSDIVFCLAASPALDRVWLGSSDAGVYELDLTAEKPQRTKLQGEGHTSYVTAMVRGGDVLVTGSYDKRLIWWDTQTGKQIRAIDGHDKWIRRLAITPDARRVISVADDMQCRVWDIESGSLIANFSDHGVLTPHHYPSMLYAVAVSPDGSRIATGDRIGHVAIWDAESFAQVGQLETPVMYTWDPKQRRHSIGGIRSLAFSPDGKRLAVGGMGKVGNIDHLDGAARLEIMDIESGDRLVEIEDKEKKGLIEQIAWAGSGEWVLVAGGHNNGFLSVFDCQSGKRLASADQSGHIHALVHDASFERIICGGHQRLSHWTLAEKS